MCDTDVNGGCFLRLIVDFAHAVSNLISIMDVIVYGQIIVLINFVCLMEVFILLMKVTGGSRC